MGSGHSGDFRMVIKTGVIASAIAFLWLVCAAPVAAAYKGQIVDAETKEPVDGVVVFMEWSYLQFNLMPHSHAFAAAYETLTDKDGRFSLPGWWSLNPWRMMTGDHLITIFKGGYEPIVSGSGVWRAWTAEENGVPKSPNVWKIEKGRPVILLKKVSDREQRMRAMDRVDYRATKDNLMLKEINKERQFFGLEPIRTE